ncbi:MAG: glycosyltransferase family 4 protein [Nitrospiria bacterium]
MKRLLFLTLGPYFPADAIPVKEKYKFMSRLFTGDVFGIVHKKEFRNFNLSNFVLRGIYLPKLSRQSSVIRVLAYSIISIVFSVYLHYFRKRKYDVIISNEPIVTGVLALIISKLTGAKFIVEVNGNFRSAFSVDSKNIGLIHRLKHKYASVVTPFVLSRADGVKLVYFNQISSLRISNLAQKTFAFPNFVAISQFKPNGTSCNSKKYILFLGFPWFLKGVDILIKAFNKICRDFPNYTLKIVGYCPDRTDYEKLAFGNSQIELCGPIRYEDVIDLMSHCALFVLPSRTDASPRVLREAMASKKPVIASNVDGIPSLIRNGYNGLLFESENVEDLALKMRLLLIDAKFAKMLAENGYRFVCDELSEECYVDKFNKMVEKVLENHVV